MIRQPPRSTLSPYTTLFRSSTPLSESSRHQSRRQTLRGNRPPSSRTDLNSILLKSSYTQISFVVFKFFFNDTATTEIYTLSLHDALPIFHSSLRIFAPPIKAAIASGKPTTFFSNFLPLGSGLTFNRFIQLYYSTTLIMG